MTSGFFLYPNYVWGLKEILSPEQYQAYIIALVELGLGARIEVKDPIINANQELKTEERGRKTAQKSREYKNVANKSHNTLLRCLRQ